MRISIQRVTRQRGLRSGGASAFSLMELLVVLAVIAILASLLSAALNSAKARAHQINCVNHLRQLQLGWIMHAEDHEDRLALNRTAPSPNLLLFGRRSATNSWVTGSPKEDTTTENIEAGTLYPYLGDADVYRCPADRSKVVGQPSRLRTRSYSLSAYMNGDQAGVDPRVKTKLSELGSNSADVFTFIEEHPNSAWGGSFVTMPQQGFQLASGTWTSTPADRHREGCNLAFADGHIEHWKWYGPKDVNLMKPPVLDAYQLKDLRRLQAAAPRR